MPRRKRSPSRSRCARRSRRPARPPRWSRPTARSRAACSPRWRAGTSRSTIPAATRSPTRRPGRFARLAAECASAGLRRSTLLALLKHPLLRLGAHRARHARAIAALELAVLRGPRPRPGSRGLAQALEPFRAELRELRRKRASDLHPSDPRTALTDAGARCSRGAGRATRRRARAARRLAVEHAAPVRRARRAPPRRRSPRLSTDRGTASPRPSPAPTARSSQAAFDEITLARPAPTVVAPSDYAELFAAAISDRVVRRPSLPACACASTACSRRGCRTSTASCSAAWSRACGRRRRARDPWLSRPMRHALGLDLPERRISLSAHDFAQALGAGEVILAIRRSSPARRR